MLQRQLHSSSRLPATPEIYISTTMSENAIMVNLIITYNSHINLHIKQAWSRDHGEIQDRNYMTALGEITFCNQVFTVGK